MTPPTPSSSPTDSVAEEFIVQLAVERGLLYPAQLDAARAMNGTAGRTLFATLIAHGALDAKAVVNLLAKEFRKSVRRFPQPLRIGMVVLIPFLIGRSIIEPIVGTEIDDPRSRRQ